MKNVCSSFLFLLVSNLIFGQIEWVGNHEFSEAAEHVQKTSDGQYVLLHGDGSGVSFFDTNGNLVLNDTSYIFSEYGASQLLELNDGSFIYVFGGFDCDVYINFITRYDKDWNLMSWDYCNGNSPVGLLSDQSVVIVGGWNDSFEKLATDNSQVWEKQLYPNMIADIAVTPDDRILVATSNGLLEYNTDGDLLDSLPSLLLDRLEILPNGNVLGEKNGNLLLFSPDFSQLGQFQQPDDIMDIAIEASEVAVLTASQKILRFDLSLNPIATVQLSGHNQTFTSLAFDGNGFIVGGGEQYGNNGHESTSSFIKHYNLDGSTNNTNEDIELTSVSQSGQIGVKDYSGIYKISIPDIDLLVTNKGTEPIHSLTANIQFSDLDGVWECTIEQEINTIFDNLDLQPGASMHLVWDEVKFYTWDNLAGENLDLCLWTSLPNHHLETNNDNDVACTQVTVATKERQPVAFSQIFNPYTDELQLELNDFFENEKTEARIFNAAGQLVHTETIAAQRQALGLGNLADGPYFLQILSGQRVGWGKFVKY